MKKKILMVCLGNICRSPLAEGILKAKVDTNNITVDSAGTSAFHQGELPDPRSISTAKKNGIDITDQRSRPFTQDDFKNFDLIYAMDNSNRTNILNLANSSEDKAKVKLILNEINPDSNSDVPDPYYGGDNGFDHVYTMLDNACDIIAQNL